MKARTPSSAAGEPIHHPERHDAHSEPHDVHMPSPSIWPIVAAFGVTMIGFGILTGWAFGIFGGLVLAISLWKWAGEMRRDAA